MKVYTFGNRENKTLMLIPGTCCHWKKTFRYVIPLLEKEYYVLCVSFDGFDETEDTVFINMIDETEKIENYVIEHFNGKIDIVYGCSLGGSFVSLLIQRQKIHIYHGILGSSDLDQANRFIAKIQCQLVTPILYKILQTGKIPRFFQKKIDKKQDEYINKMMDMFSIGTTEMSFVKKESIYNQFYYDLITSIDDNIEVNNTIIHIFYATKMGEKYLKRYKKHFKHPDIIFQNYQHEELLACYPKKWVKEIQKCTRKEGQ